MATKAEKRKSKTFIVSCRYHWYWRHYSNGEVYKLKILSIKKNASIDVNCQQTQILTPDLERWVIVKTAQVDEKNIRFLLQTKIHFDSLSRYWKQLLSFTEIFRWVQYFHNYMKNFALSMSKAFFSYFPLKFMMKAFRSF